MFLSLGKKIRLPPPPYVKFLIPPPPPPTHFSYHYLENLVLDEFKLLGVKVEHTLPSNLFPYIFTFIQCKLIIRNIFLLTLLTLSKSERASNQASIIKASRMSSGIALKLKLHQCIFLLNPKYYQNEIWSILVHCMINISVMFLVQLWRLQTSYRPFYDFGKMAI